MDNSFPLLEAENTENQGIVHIGDLQGVLTDHVKIGPVTGIEVYKSAGTLVIELQVPSQQAGGTMSRVRISRGVEQHTRQFIPTEADHQHREAPSSQ